MALKVTHLNGDSTFLLDFTPADAGASSADGHGSFSILLDPWLNGDSTIFHRKFALAKHTVPSSIQHLSEIPPPNAILISQDRSDHCHEATLKQLDADLPNTVIFAHPAAARKIRSWKYFNPSKVVAFPVYNDRKSETVIRFKIPTATPDLQPGEVTIAFIPTKFDITQLHNGIGITYRPPMPLAAHLRPFTPTVTLTPKHQPHTAQNRACMPPTPPDSPTMSQQPFGISAPVLEPPPVPKGALNKLRSRSHGALRAAAAAHNNPNKSTTDLALPTDSSIPPVPPLPSSAAPNSPVPKMPGSPVASMTSVQASDSTSTLSASPSTRTSASSARRPRTLSVIYAPHGASYAAIRHYAATHLIQRAGLPLTLLLHSFDRVQNAWYLGGNIISGMPGGLDIARNLLAQAWISAHDEDKESSGLAVIKCVVSKYSAADVQRLLAAPEAGPKIKSFGGGRDHASTAATKNHLDVPNKRQSTSSRLTTDVRQMACGEVAILTA